MVTAEKVTAHHLLKIEAGENDDEALRKWWQENGLEHTAARFQRQETYAKQKAETMPLYMMRAGFREY